MENKKSGIRLRHLQQQPQQANKRDLSPNNPNRKKIFDKNQRMKLNERLLADDKQKKKGKNEEQSFNQYEQLIQNLKKKTMEIELRDEAIKYLNKQIEDLKNQLRIKDKEIAKLNHEITVLEKENQTIKNTQKDSVFQSFKNPSQVSPFPYSETNKANNLSFETGNIKPKSNYQESRLNQQISLGNLNNFKNYSQERIDQSQIVSPFMALNNTHSFSNHSIPSKDKEAKKQVKTSRISNQNDYHHTSTQYSGFNKRKTNNEFDFSKEDHMPKRSIIDSVNKQLQKFNIFGQPPQSKKEIHARSKLEIQDSREFKFQQFQDKGYGDFGSKAIY